KSVTITLEKGSARTLALPLQRMIPQMRSNPVNVVEPAGNRITQAPEKREENANGSATENGNGAQQLFDPRAKPVAEKVLPGKDPITLTAAGNRLIAASADPEALKLVRELSRLLQNPAGEGDFEIIKLKNAKASEAAKTLDAMFNDTKRNTSRNRV